MLLIVSCFISHCYIHFYLIHEDIAVYSTDDRTLNTIYGGIGKDKITFGNDEPRTFIAQDLMGHTGLITHQVSSSDSSYNSISTPTITAYIVDNDAPGVIIREEDFNIVLENSNSSTFRYTIALSKNPITNVNVTAFITTHIYTYNKVVFNPPNFVLDSNNWRDGVTVEVSADPYMSSSSYQVLK